MMKSLHACLAAIALIAAGADGAAAKPIPDPLPKLALKHCPPHYETDVQHLGFRRIGLVHYRVIRVTTIYVDGQCRKHRVSVKTHIVPVGT
jgi:hypothetical protein